jgi:hypothetical protein
MFEEYLWLSIKLHGPLFFFRPICLGMIALMIFLFAYIPIKSALGRLRSKKKEVN